MGYAARSAAVVVTPILNAAAVAALFALLIYRHWFTGSIFDQVMQNLPILSVFAVIGLIAAVILGFVEKGSAPETGVLAVALIIGVAADIADNPFGPIVSAPPSATCWEILSASSSTTGSRLF